MTYTRCVELAHLFITGAENYYSMEKVSLNIPKGTQPNTVFSIAQRGLPNRKTGRNGNILVRIIGETPRNLGGDDLNAIEQIKSKI